MYRDSHLTHSNCVQLTSKSIIRRLRRATSNLKFIPLCLTFLILVSDIKLGSASSLPARSQRGLHAFECAPVVIYASAPLHLSLQSACGKFASPEQHNGAEQQNEIPSHLRRKWRWDAHQGGKRRVLNYRPSSRSQIMQMQQFAFSLKKFACASRRSRVFLIRLFQFRSLLPRMRWWMPDYRYTLTPKYVMQAQQKCPAFVILRNDARNRLSCACWKWVLCFRCESFLRRKISTSFSYPPTHVTCKTPHFISKRREHFHWIIMQKWSSLL